MEQQNMLEDGEGEKGGLRETIKGRGEKRWKQMKKKQKGNKGKKDGGRRGNKKDCKKEEGKETKEVCVPTKPK